MGEEGAANQRAGQSIRRVPNLSKSHTWVNHPSNCIDNIPYFSTSNPFMEPLVRDYLDVDCGGDFMYSTSRGHRKSKFSQTIINFRVFFSP